MIGLPANAQVVVSEESGLYDASYVLDNASGVEGAQTEAISMGTDHSLDFTNDFSAYAETGLTLPTSPYAGLVAAGAVLALGVHFGRKREEHAETAAAAVAAEAPCGKHFADARSACEEIIRGKHFSGGGAVR